MVSGFLTSPLLQVRMSSAVARPMRSSSKKLTSSTCLSLSLYGSAGSGNAGDAGSLRPALDLLDRRRLATGQIDAEFLGSAEDVLVAIAHLDGDAVAGQHLDVEAQRLHFLDQHLERLRDAGFRDVLALDDRLVHLDAAEDVVGLDREQLLQRVGRAVGLHGPALHLAETLAAELRLTTQRLLRDHRVGAGRAGVDLVV